MTEATLPPIGSRVRCLQAPAYAPPEYDRIVGQIGTVIRHYPADPNEPEDEPAIGISYPLTPYADNTIAQDATLEGVTWERVISSPPPPE